MKQINENIKKYRLEKGLTQQEVADQLFVTRQCISRWEQGKSVPDLENIERLSSILSVTVSDIIDDESIKSLTINEAISNRKNKKVIWMSIIISCMAIVTTIIGYSLLEQSKTEDVKYDVTYTIKGIIQEIENKNMEFESEGKLYTIYLPSISQKDVLDNKMEEMSLSDLKVGDIIRLEYINELTEDNILQLNVIDSVVDKNLLGVIFVTNGKEYQTIEDIPEFGEPGLRFYLFNYSSNGSSMTNNAEEYTYDIIVKEDYFHYIIEMDFYFDELKVNHDAAVGLVYSSGIEYIDTIDISYNESRTYTGEINYEVDQPYIRHSIDVTYKIDFNREFSFKSIEVYEYDTQHNLIKTSKLTTLDEYRYFQADDQAIYSYVKVTTEYPIGLSSYSKSKVYHLLLGDSLEILNSDEFGIINKDQFDYE